MNIFDEEKIDCHNHIFDPARFPYRADTAYRPSMQEIGTAAQFAHVMDACGVRHALLVGPTSGYRTDNRCMLDAIANGSGRFRGIAVVDNDVSRAELVELKAAGVVGLAFNPAMEGVEAMNDVDALLDTLTDLDMFAQIQTTGDQLVAIEPLIRRTSTRILIDHCGRPDVAAGTGQAGFQTLLRLADTGRVTVKLSGLQKFSQLAYPYEDAQHFALQILRAFGPDHCVWGSDWPFLRSPVRMDYAPLLTLIERLIPDPDARRRVLWQTPRRLFGF
ncbi:amidohydrolase family protein [Paraburkholderia saeva]|jgi:predicted TIM-barrel fold metal-dependent hydrolase|uniref:amidohydrolase family protein n=1 Tax=Paraburkholderia saeva TaxID=2777537 RepID=UPI001DA9F8F9|nr:amidohydrolase family protein [Paraburkholderia saeva]CAG4888310.1 4-sulfomuconolactone hydrolase [Paraburkholderia saeva]CAG4897195.1 4-sulfomuconolactone hydrolase [Paraburkholderia saeva]